MLPSWPVWARGGSGLDLQYTRDSINVSFCRNMKSLSLYSVIMSVICLAEAVLADRTASAGVDDVDMGTVEAFVQTREFRVNYWEIAEC